jgi:hypothetical protein
VQDGKGVNIIMLYRIQVKICGLACVIKPTAQQENGKHGRGVGRDCIVGGRQDQ